MIAPLAALGVLDDAQIAALAAFVQAPVFEIGEEAGRLGHLIEAAVGVGAGVLGIGCLLYTSTCV